MTTTYQMTLKRGTCNLIQFNFIVEDEILLDVPTLIEIATTEGQYQAGDEVLGVVLAQ